MNYFLVFEDFFRFFKFFSFLGHFITFSFYYFLTNNHIFPFKISVPRSDMAFKCSCLAVMKTPIKERTEEQKATGKACREKRKEKVEAGDKTDVSEEKVQKWKSRVKACRNIRKAVKEGHAEEDKIAWAEENCKMKGGKRRNKGGKGKKEEEGAESSESESDAESDEDKKGGKGKKGGNRKRGNRKNKGKKSEEEASE